MTAAARAAEVRQDGAEGGETPAAEPWPEAGTKARMEAWHAAVHGVTKSQT